MVEFTATIASTRLIKQGNIADKIAKKAIDSIPEQVNGEWSLPFSVEHDPFCLPIGKLKEAWVESFENEHIAKARIFVEDEVRGTSHVKTGTELVHLKFANVPKPFARQFEKSKQGSHTLAVDLANFENVKYFATFKDVVGHIDDSIKLENLGRHSVGPEPLIQFVFSNAEFCLALSVGYWLFRRVEKFIRYTVDEALRKIADDISESLSAKLKQLIKAYKNCRTGNKKPILVEVVVPGKPDLILLIKIEHHEDFPRINLNSLTKEMEKFGDLLQEAAEVTFSRTGTDEWEFQCLKTRTGEVFGTLECYRRTLERIHDTQDESKGDY